MKLIHSYWPIAILLLTACGPTEQQKAQLAEQRRIECLDKLCEGDIPPKHDPLKEFSFKLNGQWFIGPREYGGYGGSLAFLWPSKTPARSAGSAKTAPEFVPSSAGVNSNFYDVGIEIFLRTSPSPPLGPKPYQSLLEQQAEGRVISKTKPRLGLEVWITDRKSEGRLPVTWYVATDLRDANNEPPVMGCVGIDGSERDAMQGTCTMAFRWQPDIAADIRLSARHGLDWPEIYVEVIRVLQLLRKA